MKQQRRFRHQYVEVYNCASTAGDMPWAMLCVGIDPFVSTTKVFVRYKTVSTWRRPSWLKRCTITTYTLLHEIINHHYWHLKDVAMSLYQIGVILVRARSHFIWHFTFRMTATLNSVQLANFQAHLWHLCMYTDPTRGPCYRIRAVNIYANDLNSPL